MSTTLITTRRRQTTASTMLRRAPVAAASLRLDTALPTAVPSVSLEPEFTLLDTVAPTASATTTDKSINPSATSQLDVSTETCSTTKECATGKSCFEGKCISSNDGAPLGGSGSEPSSHLSTAAAIGIGVGVVALIGLLIGLGVCFWRIRGRRSPNKTSNSPVTGRKRSASHATELSIDNDQKTLVASFPTSPYDTRFHEDHAMAPGAFAKALESNRKGNMKYNSQKPSCDMGSMATEKSLPLAPTENPLPPAPTDNPLPPAPTEQKRYALNVNINKSIIMDEDMMRAVSPIQNSGTSRERAPRYRFEEYVPPVVNTPPISITLERPSTSDRTSEYELERFPNKNTPADSSPTKGDGTREGTQSQDFPETTFPKRDSKPPLLSLPDLRPASSSLSFRSYDWYQDILGDQQRLSALSNGSLEQTSTQAILSAPQTLSQRFSEVDPRLVPQPLTPGAPSTVATAGSEPVSEKAPSPTNSQFRLSPTVYEMPSGSSVVPSMPPVPPKVPMSPPKAARVSILSTTTRKTHNSQSWLPDDGLYLPEDGTADSWKRLGRLNDPSRPTSYSPLS
ncbi:Nn.00g073860.m01.CDS01 [Neocucurbitaria sp. VM-36]